MRAFALNLVAASALSLGTQTWVPIFSNGRTQYFNPETSEMRAAAPAGAALAPMVAAPKSNAVSLLTQDPNVEAAPEAEQSSKKACYPHCSWNCTQPVCNQDCTPDCEQPRCQTRCPRPDYSQCAIDCQTPHCSVFCPKDACKDNDGENCSSPKCSTRCARPVCYLKCQNNLPCQNVCHPPRCTWNCRNPNVCAKPQCRLVCERAQGCAQNYELPALSPEYTVNRQFHAEKAHWVTFKWGKCGNECGKAVRTRKVLCSTGEDHECSFSAKPPTQEECEDNSGCNGYIVGEWSGCSQQCGKGKKMRKVFCNNPDEKECLGEKPHEEEQCWDHGPHCRHCQVTLFGGPTFDGWSASFAVGQYSSDDLIGHGAKCEETSSMKVDGMCCKARVYQYGDFNQQTEGWTARVGHGNYTSDDLVDAGVENNDVSSMKIWLDEKCSRKGKPVVGWKIPQPQTFKMDTNIFKPPQEDQE